MSEYYSKNNIITLLHTLEMNEERFLLLLDKLINESIYLQNSPSQGLIPIEDKASNHVIELFKPYTKENGGVLEVERISFVEGRGNVIIKYPGTTDKICSFVGSHLDVVPADPKGWDKNPFKLIREDNKLYGRGTTDCLGHIAVLVDFFISLAEKRVPLKTTIVAVFIANEENSGFKGIGIDQLVEEGYLDELKAGPMFWIDAADSQPCIGTAGMLQWKIKATGKLFHSGLPHKGVNAIELGIDATNYIQTKFFQDFPKHPKEIDYNFATQSTFKTTQIHCSPGALNQLPSDCVIQGDVRLSPFYDIHDVKKKLAEYVNEINDNISILENSAIRGPHSKYILYDRNENNELVVVFKGKIELEWVYEGENGIACNITSNGHHALKQATETILGHVKPYSIGGSLPLVRQLQESGFDLQISGYGLSSRYHADNEYVDLNDLKNATKIIAEVS